MSNSPAYYHQEGYPRHHLAAAQPISFRTSWSFERTSHFLLKPKALMPYQEKLPILTLFEYSLHFIQLYLHGNDTLYSRSKYRTNDAHRGP